MKIAIFGAPSTGKTWLASALAQHFRAPVRHGEGAAQVDVLIPDTTPLMTAMDSNGLWSERSIHEWALAHQRSRDLTLLTGLDLPWTGEHQQEQHRQQTDARLRDALQEAGIAYGVVYGSGPQRLRNALRLVSPQDTPPARWTGVCEKCSDPDCEFQLFTALRNLKAAAPPAS
jgi:nicotinamide riboside kinase